MGTAIEITDGTENPPFFWHILLAETRGSQEKSPLTIFLLRNPNRGEPPCVILVTDRLLREGTGQRTPLSKEPVEIAAKAGLSFDQTLAQAG
jgi:hypothetical protein